MKNFIQPGEQLTIPAPATVASGAGVRAGMLFGVANHDAESGDDVTIATCGVFTLPKATGSAWTVGAALYWNGTACTITAGTGNILVGVAVAAAASGDAEGTVRLNGAAPAAQT